MNGELCFFRNFAVVKQIILSIIIIALAACSRPTSEFTIDVLNSYTPVKNQGNMQTCWAYAMLSAIETEHIMRGDSVHLSVAFVEKVMEQDPAAPRSKRGMGLTLVNMIQKYGIVPYESMRDTLTPLPRRAFMLGADYTLQEFARSVCAPDEYVGIGSQEGVDCYTLYEPRLKDNWEHNRLLAVPRDSLADIVAQAVSAHRGVCWEGDTSEPGFDWTDGVARLSFINGSTTDDHCMAIVGLAHDAAGQRYFVMKNSWGQKNRYHGLMFMHEDYLREKTIAVYLPRDAVHFFAVRKSAVRRGL